MWKRRNTVVQDAVMEEKKRQGLAEMWALPILPSSSDFHILLPRSVLPIFKIRLPTLYSGCLFP